MSLLPYDSNQPWAINIADFASALESVLEERTGTRRLLNKIYNDHVGEVTQEETKRVERAGLSPFGFHASGMFAEGNSAAVREYDALSLLIADQLDYAREGFFWCDPDGPNMASSSAGDRNF